MKKNGFTLAEVLITLAIIGVVAVLTLPALNSNTQEQQARTALKKMSNTFTQAASMNADQVRFCRRCGEKLIDGSNFCHKCGTATVKE